MRGQGWTERVPHIRFEVRLKCLKGTLTLIHFTLIYNNLTVHSELCAPPPLPPDIPSKPPPPLPAVQYSSILDGGDGDRSILGQLSRINLGYMTAGKNNIEYMFYLNMIDRFVYIYVHNAAE